MTDGAGLTEDGFLGGRLSILQPAKGYRAGVDPVLLAAAVPASSGQTVLDLGCGVGVAGLCLQARVGGLDLTGLEIQPDHAELARRNAHRNNLQLTVVIGDVRQMPTEIRGLCFDHVVTNPPYYRRTAGTPSAGGREIAMGESLPLAHWIDAAVRRLNPKGRLTVIQHVERLRDLLAACDDRLGDIRLLPLTSREGRPADRVILHASKGRRGALRLLAPLVLHDGGHHVRGEENYRQDVADILRKGSALPVAFG